MELVSIITPAFNAREFIESAIESVKAQTVENWEMIIVDDCSQDDTFDFVTQLALHDSRIRVFSLSSNQGAAAARNLAIGKATGRFIAFLDSDDCWYPEKLETQLNYMQRTSASFVCSGYRVVNRDGAAIAEFMPPETATYHDLLRTCSVGCLTAIYDTEKFGKVLMPLIKRRQDYGLWLDLLRKGGECHGIQEILGEYRIGGSSLSNNKFKAAQYQWIVYREVEELSLIKSCYYFVNYCVNGLLKYRN